MPKTRLADLSQRKAVLLLVGLATLLVCSVLASRPGRPQQSWTVNNMSDSDVMWNIVKRVHHGEGYYPAAADELRTNGYGLRSVFNWRQPAFAWVLALFPHWTVGWVLLGLTNLVAILLVARQTARDGNAAMAVVAFWLLAGASYGCFLGWGPVTLEVVGGVVILLSIYAYSHDRWKLGLGLGLAGLFLRELIAPYVVVCILMALVERRPRELLLWAIGLVCYAGYFAWHANHVWAQMRPADIAYPSGWVQFNGLWFIVATAAEPVLLMNRPMWMTAIYLTLAIAGVLAIPGRFGVRIALTVGIYIAFFWAVGKDFNDYWGFLYGPLLAIGVTWAPAAIRDLWGLARGELSVENARIS